MVSESCVSFGFDVLRGPCIFIYIQEERVQRCHIIEYEVVISNFIGGHHVPLHLPYPEIIPTLLQGNII